MDFKLLVGTWKMCVMSGSSVGLSSPCLEFWVDWLEDLELRNKAKGPVVTETTCVHSEMLQAYAEKKKTNVTSFRQVTHEVTR